MTESTWLDRLTDTYLDFGLTSLVVLLVAVGVAVVVHHFYFRWRLEPAVEDGIGPQAVRLETLGVALMTVAVVIALFSDWGFAWIAVLLILALGLVFAAGARMLLGVAIALFIFIALALVILK